MNTKPTHYAAALLLAVTLSGCSVGGGSTSALAPVVAEATPSAAPTPTEIPGDTNGDGKLSEREKEILAKNAPRDFTLTDGTVVSVDPQAPLPAEVVDELFAQLLPFADKLRTSPADGRSPGNIADMRDQVDALSDSLGKGLVVIFKTQSNDGSGNIALWACMASGIRISPVQALADGDVLNAEVQTWAETRGYEVIRVH